MLIPEIDSLLDADAKNALQMPRVFADFSQDLPELLNKAATLHTTSIRAFAQGIIDCAPDLPEGRVDEASSNEWEAKLIWGLLLCRIGVLYGIAIAEFLRTRITTPFACIRIQCESLALIKLIHERPALAQEWQNIATDEQGAAFYRKYQSRVKEVLRSYNLEFSYNKASSLVLHSRFAGITFGYRQLNPPDINQLHNFFSLYAQEFDPHRPDLFLVYVIHTLRVQERIFSNISDAVPEIQDRLLLETRIPQFRTGVEGLHQQCVQQFAQRRPDLVEHYAQQMAMDANPPQAGHAKPVAGRKGKRRKSR